MMKKILDSVSVIFYIMTNLSDTAETPAMTFREKAHWIALLASLCVWGHYFARVVIVQPQGPEAFWLFAGSLGVVLAAQAILMVLVALREPRGRGALDDERDNLIELKGFRFAYVVLTVLALAAAGLVLVDAPATVVANGVVLAIVVAEAAKSILELTAYRRGLA